MISKTLQKALNKELKLINNSEKYTELDQAEKEILCGKNVLKNSPEVFDITNQTDTMYLQILKKS
jgi:hypothetical protein